MKSKVNQGEIYDSYGIKMGEEMDYLLFNYLLGRMIEKGKNSYRNMDNKLVKLDFKLKGAGLNCLASLTWPF